MHLITLPTHSRWLKLRRETDFHLTNDRAFSKTETGDAFFSPVIVSCLEMERRLLSVDMVVCAVVSLCIRVTHFL